MVSSGYKKLSEALDFRQQNADNPPVTYRYKTLADYFEQTGRTQQSLAAELNVTRACVSQWVGRTREMSLSMALRVSRMTGVRLDGLTRERVAA